ncbi:MAG: TlpA family protein disulfide reductase [Blastocatellia bacterium]
MAQLFVLLSISTVLGIGGTGGGADYTGQFNAALVANTEEFERVVLKGSTVGLWKAAGSFAANAHFSTGQLINPLTGEFSIRTLLVEEEGEDPVLFVDLNGDNTFATGEKQAFQQAKTDNPYLWHTTVSLEMKGGFFTSCPIFVRYLKSVRVDKMTREDRLITQSTEVFARGAVDVKGKKILVQYAVLAGGKKVNHQEGWLGIDADGNGLIDMDNLSPEAAKADKESVIFRVGDTYISTKKADVSKNQIILREHDAKEYKRLELYLGKEFPDFGFSDFDGKKRKFSEFRGKYVLLDIWGFWCPPCRKELPYIREAHRRFRGRNLEIIGLNTDADYTIDSMKKGLRDNGMLWTNARFDSVVEFLRSGLRISSFPTTFLISPEGKIISMSRQERDEPDLRGEDLLESLDEALPD